MFNDVLMTICVNSGSGRFCHPPALLRDIRLSGEHCSISCGLISLTSRLAIVFNVHLIDVEWSELICNLLLTAFSNQQLASSVENDPFADSLLAFIRIRINFLVREATSSYDLEDVGEVLRRDSTIAGTIHHLPHLFE